MRFVLIDRIVTLEPGKQATGFRIIPADDDYLRAHGEDRDWERYAHHFVFPEISGLSERELRAAWRRAMLTFSPESCSIRTSGEP